MDKRFELRIFIRDLITGAALAVLVFLLGRYRGYGLLRCLCDAFFVPAVLLIGIAGIMLARNAGTFDTMGYSVRFTFFNHFPGAKYKDETIYEYIERKEKTRKSSVNPFLAGVVFFVPSVVFLILYYGIPA